MWRKGGCLFCRLSWPLSLFPASSFPPAASLILDLPGQSPTERAKNAPLTSHCHRPLGWTCEMGKHHLPPPRAAGRITRLTGAGTLTGASPGQGKELTLGLQVDRPHLITLPCTSHAPLGVIILQIISVTTGVRVPLLAHSFAHVENHMPPQPCL